MSILSVDQPILCRIQRQFATVAHLAEATAGDLQRGIVGGDPQQCVLVGVLITELPDVRVELERIALDAVLLVPVALEEFA